MKSNEKQLMAEDYYFQRVHYQRDIKVELMKAVKSVSRNDSRKLEIDELPPLHRAAARGNLPEIKSLLDADEHINAPLPFQAVRTDSVNDSFYFEGVYSLALSVLVW
jgi:hypothetical protein